MQEIDEVYDDGYRSGYSDGYRQAEYDYEARLGRMWAEIQTLNARVEHIERFTGFSNGREL